MVALFLSKYLVFFTEHLFKILAEDSKSDAKKLKPTEGEPISSTDTDPNQLPITVSDALANFLGTEEKEMPQSEAVKRVWDHIKSNNLEVSGLLLSDPLRTVFFMIVLV
jgi:chromatin remodeling complex protein RSC6